MTFEPLLGAAQALIDAGRIPGVVLRVCRGGEVEVEAALGVMTPKDGRPMQTDTIFRIYSMTKPITTVAAMMLIEGGQIKLDEPIARIFPEFQDLAVGVETADANGTLTPQPEPLERVATVRDLMRHTAGFTYGTFGDSLLKARYRAAGVDRRDISSDTFIKTLASMPLAYQPGTTWEYGRATDVLGIMVERVSGISLADFFSERIFAPLGMVDSGFTVAPQQSARLAEAFEIDPDLGTPIVLNKMSRVPGYFSGGGGLVSTLDDYQRFIDLLRARGSAGGVRLLSSSSVDLMTRDHLGQMSRGKDYLPGSDSGFGLGFAVRIKDSPLGHRGDYFWSGIAGTHFWIDPSMDLSATWLMQAPHQRTETTELFGRFGQPVLPRLNKEQNMSHAEGEITTELSGQLFLIGIKRPAKLNGFTPKMMRELAAAYTALEDHPEATCGVLFAHGDHFTAGLDLPSMAPFMQRGELVVSPNDIDPFDLHASATGRRREKPLVAAVRGITYTLGIELMLAADIVVAASDCRFAQLEVKRGIMATGGATIRITERAGIGNANLIMLTGDEFNAVDAERMGLVQRVVEPGQVLAAAIEIATRIARQAPLAVRATRRSILRASRDGADAAYSEFGRIQGKLANNADAKEGVASFVERRAPHFKGE